MKNIENTTKRHISITMLTWDLIDEVEAITGQLVFEDDICREIEHDLYCACMNQHNSDPSQTEMEWFIYELTVTMKYGKTEAMKEVAKHLHDMLTKPATEAQETTNNETTNEEEQTMNTNTKVNEEQRAFFFRMGYNDVQRHAIKYGMDDVGTMIGDYIKVVNVQHSWDEMEFAYVEGMLTYLEAQKIPQEA